MHISCIAMQEVYEVNWFSVYATLFGILTVCLYYLVRFSETVYAHYYSKPFYVHWYFNRKSLSVKDQKWLKKNDFYQKLSTKQKRNFDHRVNEFINNTRFIGRNNLDVTDDMKLRIAYIAIMLTFGMRNYLHEYLETIIIFPSSFYSPFNQTENKGEYNPRFKSLVFSWEDFIQSTSVKDNSVNLGIHELTHVIHYTALKNNDISSEIFYDSFLRLENCLRDKDLRLRFSNSKILREYAFTNKYEFIAVLIEVFIETPQKLKSQFPSIYLIVQRMLNFRFAGY